MHYTDTELGTGRRLRIGERLRLLDQDVGELLLPTSMPTAHELADLIYRMWVIGTNLRRVKLETRETLDKWRQLRERVQQAVGGSDAMNYSDTGEKRKAMRRLISATWGPVNPEAPSGDQGIKRLLLPVERQSALQLAGIMFPKMAVPPTDGEGEDESTPEMSICEYSYDDLVGIGESNLLRIELLEKDIETRHFDINNLVKLVEEENRAVRQAPPER